MAEGPRGEKEGEVIYLEDRRCSLTYLIYNGWMQGQLQLSIWGLPLSMINKLTVVGAINQELRKNRIYVSAGDESGKMSLIYKGTIWSAYGDFQSAPENVFHIMALSAAFEAVKPSVTRSYPGEYDMALVLEELADEIDLVLENNIPEPILLRDRYYTGDAVTQLKTLCGQANINWAIERGILSLWPKGGARVVAPTLINPETGMIGYPQFSAPGIIVTTLFNPDLIQGGRVDVLSSLTPACGIWSIMSLSHTLESEIPGGLWQTQMSCQRIWE